MKPYLNLPGSVTGKTIIITGGSDGIGAAAAKHLSSLGAKIVIVGRSKDKTTKLAESLKADYFICDFAVLDQVRDLAIKLNQKYQKIDILINNAGLIGQTRELTVDGHERTFQINHLSPFLLTNLLYKNLISARATIITTSSAAHLTGKVRFGDLDYAKGFRALSAYSDSKLYNIMMTKEITRRWHADGISTACFHPGVVKTHFGQGSNKLFSLMFKLPFAKHFLSTPDQGADTMVWLASGRPGADFESGGYYAKRKLARVIPIANDVHAASKLWNISLELVGIKPQN